MKNIIVTIALLISYSASASTAVCEGAYNKAIKRRNTVNQVGSLVGTYSMLPVAIYAGPVVSTVAVLAYHAGLLVITPKAFDRNRDNRFEKIQKSFLSAKSNRTTAFSKRLIKKAIKKADLEVDFRRMNHALYLLSQGYENGTFCPVVKVRKNGTEKRAVFNRRALIKYLSANL